MPDGGGGLPFQEAIDYLAKKVNVKSATYGDIREGAHARAFTVAGATKDGMLADFRAAVTKAIADGTTIETFRKDFDDIVARYGWDYKGGRNWRSRVIYETNIRTAYAAGRYSQMTDPDLVKVRPYWQYHHSDTCQHPRPEHLAWDGLILAWNDPWWSTHYPPNGWGCGCTVTTLSARDLMRLGKDGPDKAPPVNMGTGTILTSSGPLQIPVPAGIDPGWGYSVGEANQGKRLAQDQMQAWQDSKAGVWESLTPGDYASAGRPAQIPLDPPIAAPIDKAFDPPALQRTIEAAIGGPSKLMLLPTGDSVMVDAASLAAHMPPDRARFVPFLTETIKDPFEVWLRFERHKGTGKVVLRQRVIKAVNVGKGQGLLLVLQSSAGGLEAWTMIPSKNLQYVQNQRVGRLIYSRK